MDPADADTLDFDPLDDTKVWSEEKYPLIKVGLMTLNRNPENFFAQVEQSAFCPANIVPGITFSADKMLQGRSFSYTDTQRHRIGANFAQLPINHPLSHIANNQQVGNMTFYHNSGSINYSPNSLNNNNPKPATLPTIPPEYISGYINRTPIDKENNFVHAGAHYNSLTPEE